MLRPFHIALLELKRYIADRGDLAFGIALPIGIFALMYGVFTGATTFHVTAHVVDLDGGPIAEQLITRLEQTDGLTVKLHTERDANNKLNRSGILTAFFIPNGFSEALQTGNPASLTVKQRGSGGDEGQIVASIVRGVAQELAGDFQVRQIVENAMVDSSAPRSQIDTTVTTLLDQARHDPPVAVNSQTIGGDGGEDIVGQLVPGILTMFMLFAVTLGAQTLVEERRLGTLERLLTTRLSINQLFMGKFLAGVARATFQALVLLALAFAVLRLAGAWTFLQTIAFSLLMAAAMSSIALIIAALARTRDQAIWAAVFFTMFMTIFGGTFFDVGDSGSLAVLSRFTVNRYAIDALDGIISGGEGIGQQGIEIAVMTGIAIVGLLLARAAFRVRSGGR